MSRFVPHFLVRLKNKKKKKKSSKNLVLVEDDVEHFGRTLGQFFGGHHLHVEVSRLRFAARLD